MDRSTILSMSAPVAPFRPAPAVPSYPAAAPTRAPALYLTGHSAADPSAPAFACRLPCPPNWDDRAPGARAAERRARRAYFAALDALHTGTVDAEDEAKCARLAGELRSNAARGAVTHFLRIFALARRAAGTPLLAAPAAPLETVTITAPAVGVTEPDLLAARFRWALEWLDARRFVVGGKRLRVQWQVRRITLGGVVVEAAGGR